MSEEQENILNEYVNQLLRFSSNVQNKKLQRVYLDKLQKAYDAHESKQALNDIIETAYDDIREQEYLEYEEHIDRLAAEAYYEEGNNTDSDSDEWRTDKKPKINITEEMKKINERMKEIEETNSKIEEGNIIIKNIDKIVKELKQSKQENILNEYINRMLCISKDIGKDKQQIYIDKLKQAYEAHEDRTVYDDILYSALDDNKIKPLKIFDFNNKLLTVYGTTIDNPLFKATSLAKMLGYDTDQAIIKYVDEEDIEKVTRQSGYDVYINKRGFKTLLLKCDKVIKPEFLDFLKDNLDIDIDIFPQT